MFGFDMGRKILQLNYLGLADQGCFADHGL
jgi:hypothetical protein